MVKGVGYEYRGDPPYCGHLPLPMATSSLVHSTAVLTLQSMKDTISATVAGLSWASQTKVPMG